MNSDEYQKVKEIFHSVLDLTVEERSVYLAENCSLDPTIRHEVERLLRTYQPSYLEQPAIAQFAASADTDGLVCGQRIGHFTIVEKIGAGGMGEVYLAEDEKLGRQVAIKLLPKTFTDDTDWLIRFEQEARTASALNHPNIITVFEIGEADRTRYIATEYIDGVTLRAKLNRGKLSVHEALDIAIQCASALATAHENGIIHRDIKPENIMLRRDNLVKVLDFGLAKLVEKSEPVSHDAPTEKHIKTAPGVIMGTVQYMSPEQTRGHATDARTDIWSLGVVIYEMVAGRPPFAADNSADLIAEIVRTRVEPLSRYEHDIPEQLEEIVDKALSKDPDDRYQTVRDLSVDLKRLNRRLDTEFASDLSNEDLLSISDPSISAPNIISTRKGPKDLTTVSSAEYLIWGIKAHRLTAFGITLFVLSLLGGTAWLVRNYWRDPIRSDALIEYERKVKLAAQALNVLNYSQAKKLLDETKPVSGEEDLRGFEWGYLVNVLSEASASPPLQFAQNGSVYAVAFSPDRKTLATAPAGAEHIVQIWDLNTGNNLRSFPGHTAGVMFVDFSPDGRTLLTTGFDWTAKTWDVATGEMLLNISETRGVARFSNDGSMVVISKGRDIVFWDAVTGIEKSRFTSPVDPGAFVFSPDGKYLAIRDQDQSIHVLSAADKRAISTIKGHSDLVRDFEFSPNSNLLVTASKDKTARLWDVRSGKELHKFEGHDDEISEVVFSPDGKKIATGSNDRTIKLWDVTDGFEITTLRAHAGNVIALAYSPDGRKLASGGTDNMLRVWNASGLRQRGVLRGHFKQVTRLMFSPSGRSLLSSSADKTAKVWDIESEQELVTLGGPDDPVQTAIYSSDDGRILTAGEDNKIKLWDPKTSRQLLTIDSPVAAQNLAVSRDGKLLVTGHASRDVAIRFWDLTNGKLRCETGDAHKGGPWSIGFTSDDRVVSAHWGNRAVLIWEPTTCKEVSSYEGDQDGGNYLWFGPNNSWRAIQTLEDGRSLKWIDPTTARELATFGGHDADFKAALFSPDGNRLVTSDANGMIRIWDSKTGLELLSFQAMPGDENLALSPDGNTLAVGGPDGTIRLFRSSFAN